MWMYFFYNYSKGKSGNHSNTTQNSTHELLQQTSSNITEPSSTHSIHSHHVNSRVPLSAAATRTTSALYGPNDAMSLFSSGTGFGSTRQHKPVLPPAPHTGTNYFDKISHFQTPYVVHS